MTLSLADVAAILGVVILLYKAIKQTPKETKLLDATAMEKYDKLLASGLERSVKQDGRITELEKEQATLTKENEEKNKEICDLKVELITLRNIVQRLEYQVLSLGGKPVGK